MTVADIIEYIMVLSLGLLLGSFAGALSYRIPRKLSWASFSGKESRSACPFCNTTLTMKDLVPVLSWLLRQGQCGHCSAPISVRYPLIELSSAVICLVLYAILGWNMQLWLAFAAVPFGLAFAVMIIERRQ